MKRRKVCKLNNSVVLALDDDGFRLLSEVGKKVDLVAIRYEIVQMIDSLGLQVSFFKAALLEICEDIADGKQHEFALAVAGDRAVKGKAEEDIGASAALKAKTKTKGKSKSGRRL